MIFFFITLFNVKFFELYLVGFGYEYVPVSYEIWTLQKWTPPPPPSPVQKSFVTPAIRRCYKKRHFFRNHADLRTIPHSKCGCLCDCRCPCFSSQSVITRCANIPLRLIHRLAHKSKSFSPRPSIQPTLHEMRKSRFYYARTTSRIPENLHFSSRAQETPEKI